MDLYIMDITFNYKNLSPFIKKYKINNKLILINYYNKFDNLELIYELDDYKYNILDAKVKNIKIFINNEEITNYSNYNLRNAKVIKLILDKDFKEYIIDYVRLYSNIKSINVNTFFSKIFVISLKNEIRNKQIISDMFNKHNINFEFVDAVEGKNNDECIEIFNKYQQEPLFGKNSHIMEHKLNKKLISNLGEVGYLKSWEKIILNAIDNNLDNILIFDDDVILHKNFNCLIVDYLYYINKYKVINLGNSEFCAKDLIDFNKINDNLSYYNCTDLTDGSFAVAVHNSIYSELLQLIRRFNAPLDTGCLRDLYIKYPNECYSCSPNIAIAWVGKNGIHNKKDMYKTAIKLNWNLNNYNWFPYFNEKILLFYIVDTYQKINDIKKIFKIYKNDNIDLIIINKLDFEFFYKNNEIKIIRENEVLNYLNDNLFFGFISTFEFSTFENKFENMINNNLYIFLSKNFNNNLQIKINNFDLCLADSFFLIKEFLNFINKNNILEFNFDIIKNYILHIYSVTESNFNLTLKNKKIQIK